MPSSRLERARAWPWGAYYYDDLVAFAREEVARKLEDMAAKAAADAKVVQASVVGVDTGVIHQSGTLLNVAAWLRTEAQRVREGRDDE